MSAVVRARPRSLSAAAMLALISRLLDWFRSLFWKEEMELTLVGLQYSGKTTFVNVIAVSSPLRAAWPASRACHLPEGPAGRSCVCWASEGCSRRGSAARGSIPRCALMVVGLCL